MYLTRQSERNKLDVVVVAVNSSLAVCACFCICVSEVPVKRIYIKF